MTLASESGAKDSVIRMSPSNEKRGTVVIFEDGESAGTVLQGFTLTGGTGTRWGAEFFMGGGGGILCLNGSSPTIADCEIRGNAAEKGGGIYCYGSAPTLRRCTVAGNRGGTPGADGNSYGAGVYCAAGSPAVLEDCEISGNFGLGGGLYLDLSDATITRCKIVDNEKLGAFCLRCVPVFQSCTIARNYSPEAVAKGEEGGPGLGCNNGGNPKLIDCTISENRGAGVLAASGAHPELSECTLDRNFGNGGFCRSGSSIRFRNCKITGNSSSRGGAVMVDFNSKVTIEGSTIAGNSTLQGGAVFASSSGTNVKIDHTTISGNAARLGGGVYCEDKAEVTRRAAPESTSPTS